MSEIQDKSRILIVDDDAMNIYILREILGHDYLLETAMTGEDALRQADEFAADMILLDIMMPDLNGYELCRRFRQNPAMAFTKIILVSAKSMLKDRLEGYRAGADDYITKPFDPEELKAKVKVFLRLKSVEEVERVKDDIINVFSHETRTPLNAIIGFSRILSENSSLTDNEREAVSHIRDSGLSLMGMVDKTILLSSLRKGTRRLKSRKISVVNVIQTSLVKQSEIIEQKNIQPLLDVAEDIILELDEELMVTAISYVIDNAVKFSPQDAELEIRADMDERGLRLHIRDFGRGLPEDKLATLFSAFTVDDVTHHGHGHGLGLAIVKNVMHLHGGGITAHNNASGKGSTFTLFFPMRIVTRGDQ